MRRQQAVQSANSVYSEASSSTSAVVLLPAVSANQDRQAVILFNDSTALLTVYLGTDAELTAGKASFTVAAGAREYLPAGYVGAVAGKWAAVNGKARITTLV